MLEVARTRSSSVLDKVVGPGWYKSVELLGIAQLMREIELPELTAKALLGTANRSRHR
jgi:hypothetical protein